MCACPVNVGPRVRASGPDVCARAVGACLHPGGTAPSPHRALAGVPRLPVWVGGHWGHRSEPHWPWVLFLFVFGARCCPSEAVSSLSGSRAKAVKWSVRVSGSSPAARVQRVCDGSRGSGALGTLLQPLLNDTQRRL